MAAAVDGRWPVSAADARPGSSFGLEVDRVEAFALEIMQRHRQHSGIGVDMADAIELQTVERRAVLLQVTRDADEFGLLAKRQVHLVGPKGPGIDWAGDKLPERVEVGETGASVRSADRK